MTTGTPSLTGSDLSFANLTTINPIGLAMVVVLGVATLVLPRRYALVPLFLMACFVAPAQRIVVFSLDFSLLRIMVLFSVARILILSENRGIRWSLIDTLFVGVWVANSIVYAVQWGTVDAIINRLGIGFESLGVYFLARVVIRDWDDVFGFIRIASVIAVPVAVFFLIENHTQRNLFSVFGGVPAITSVREGRLRCQGPFAHPIIAGVFWASLLPLFATQWWQGVNGRLPAIAGVGGVLVIVYCCASSTPVFAVASAGLGVAFFVMRGRMRYVVWFCVAGLTGLHLIMKAPVWHLISRVSAVGGSTGWHRFDLIDQTIHRFSEWVFLGVKTTGHWGYGLQDVTNQFVLYAVTGGILTLALFVWLLVAAFRGVGRAVEILAFDRPRQLLAWSIGVTLFVHCMCFIGVSYFGQANLILYLSFALAASVSAGLYPSASTSAVGGTRGPENGHKRFIAAPLVQSR